jgi:hypothetical protein
MTPEELDRVGNEVIGAAIEVHRVLESGLLESAYGNFSFGDKCLSRLCTRIFG